MNPQVKKEHYFRKKYDDLNRFISYFYQIDLVRQLCDADLRINADQRIADKEYQQSASSAFYPQNPHHILEIGKGNGTVSDYLKKLGFRVTTCDFDESLEPDYVADIRKLPFSDNKFDGVLAYEILEHLPFEELPAALSELRRVTKKYVFLSLPYRSTGFEFILKFPLIRSLCKKNFLDFFVRIPLKFGGLKSSGQHHWEIDGVKFPPRKLRRVFSGYFKIVKEFRPPLNYYHYFFVLEKL